MTVVAPQRPLPARSASWKWWVCGLLLLATMLNYMDRLTLNLTSKLILRHFRLDEGDYAQLESAFAFAFALGAIVFGWMADRWSVRWLYPAALLGWSVAGLVTGLSKTFLQLLLCRFALGLFEAGNWPCALRTTQHILAPAERTLGNSILQSGAAVGAIVTPLIVVALASEADPATWRFPFLAVGVLGLFWVCLWLPSVRASDVAVAKGGAGPSLMNILAWLAMLIGADFLVHLAADNDFLPWLHELIRRCTWLPLAVKVGVTALGIAGVFVWLRQATHGDTALPRPDFFRRFWVLVVLVVAVNTTWHYFRAWLPLFLQTQRGYSLAASGWFILAFYVSTDIGSLTSGFVVLALARRGLTVYGSRAVVFLACALLTLLSLVVTHLPAGVLLQGVLLVVGFASLGLFPVYYAFSQDLTVRHQGKVTGALGCINWLAMALLHELVGDSIKRTGNYSDGLALAGLTPVAGFLVLWLLWRPGTRHAGETATQAPTAPAGSVPRMSTEKPAT
jgi:ACS family hexuronate transporter-like MFS transporter